MEKNPLSFQLKLNPDDFLPATDEEKESLVERWFQTSA